MKASELIAALQRIVAESGDMEVFVGDVGDHGNYYKGFDEAKVDVPSKAELTREPKAVPVIGLYEKYT